MIALTYAISGLLIAGSGYLFLTPLEAASIESPATDFAAPSSELPKIPDLDAREPTTISNNPTVSREPADAQEEMPLIGPVVTEAEHAGLQDPAREIAPMPLFLVGALMMLLLCAGAIFKLARRKTQSYRRGRRVVSSRPRRLHPGQKMRANMSETAARSNDFARRSVSEVRQRPSSVDPAHDVKASLRKIMQACERSWMTYSASPHKARRPAAARAPRSAMRQRRRERPAIPAVQW
jgi:hypothetical protein